MDKRTILALVLMALVLVVTPMLFPSSRRTAPPATADTSNARASQPSTAPTTPSPNTTTVAPPPVAVDTPTRAPLSTAVPRLASVATESTTVSVQREQLLLVNPGAVPVAARLTGYRNLRPDRRDTGAVIAQTRGPLLHYRLAMGPDTVALDSVRFAVAQSGSTVTFTSTTPAVSISYQPTSGGFRTAVRGTVANAPPGSALLIDLPSELRSVEADTVDDLRHLAYGFKMPLRSVASVSFSKVDPGETRVDTGSFQWVSARNKYWLV